MLLQQLLDGIHVSPDQHSQLAGEVVTWFCPLVGRISSATSRQQTGKPSHGRKSQQGGTSSQELATGYSGVKSFGCQGFLLFQRVS